MAMEEIVSFLLTKAINSWAASLFACKGLTISQYRYDLCLWMEGWDQILNIYHDRNEGKVKRISFKDVVCIDNNQNSLKLICIVCHQIIMHSLKYYSIIFKVFKV